MALNTRRVEESVWAPPPGEVTTLVAVTAGTWPAGTRLLVGDPSDTPATATVLGSSVVSADGLTATWALSEADCAILRSRPRFMVQVPSGAAWEGILAGTVNLEPAWSGGRAVQRLGTVMVGPQGPAGAGADPAVINAAVSDYLAANPVSVAELIRDTMGTALVAGTNVTITKDDPGDTITIAASSSTITADDTPAAPAEGESASYFVTSAVVWPAGLVWSTVSTSGPAIVTLYTVGGITYAVLGATFPAPVVPDTTAPTVPAGLSATATGTATVDLSWSASTDAGGVTGYEYAINAGAAVDAGAGTTETVSGLAAATLYSFTVRAYDAAGNRSAWSTAATATTQAPPDTTAPTWTATVTMGTPTETSVVATASALAADNSGSVTYEVSYNSGSTWAAIVPSGSNFTLAGSPSTTYATTKLRAKDAAGNYSTPVLSVPSYTMAASDDVTGPTVGTMSASSITSSGFTLTVSSAADEAGGSGLHATPYAFTTDGTNYGAYQASPVYTASGLAASTSYSCNWRVRDAAGNVSTGTAQTVTTGAGATVIAADTFTRADSDTLGTTEVGAKAWADGAWRVASNKANQPSAGESVAIIYALPADCTVSATFTLGTARACAGLLFRYADASNQWQAALVKTAGLSQVELSKKVGGAFTRDIYPTALSLGGTYSLEVTASGSSITVKLDGAIIITKTDSYASTATIAGLWSYVAGVGDDGTTTVDNFEVRSIT